MRTYFKQKSRQHYPISRKTLLPLNVYALSMSPLMTVICTSFSIKLSFQIVGCFFSMSLLSICSGICQSTTLPLCRGILPYDLTNVRMSKSITTPQDLEHFQYLIESKCSKRSHEFVCSILEPECRPEHMGPLLPCKRICKGKKYYKKIPFIKWK